MTELRIMPLWQQEFWLESWNIHGTLYRPQSPGIPGSDQSARLPLAVLLHNGFDSSLSWEGVIPALCTSGWQVLCYDRQGYGKSHIPGQKPFLREDMVEQGREELESVLGSHQLAELLGQTCPGTGEAPPAKPLTASGLPRIGILVGHCMGGAIALDFTLAHPELVDALVLEAVGYASSSRIRRRTDWVLQPWNCLEPELKIHLERMHGPWAEHSWGHIHNHRSSYVMSADYNVLDRLEDLACPTLIMQGDRDFYFSLQDAREAAQRIRNCSLALFADKGHDLHARHTPEFLDSLLDFISSLPAQTGSCS